jgi:uncharacterized protein (UPF0261 family)
VEQNLGVATDVCPEVAIMVNGRIAGAHALRPAPFGRGGAAALPRRQRGWSALGKQAMSKVYVIGTCDTKEAELLYAKRLIEAQGVPGVLVDVGTKAPGQAPDVTAAQVAAYHPEGAGAVLGLDDRGRAVAGMGVALARFLATRDDIGAVLGLGGSGNTALVTEGMRSLPIGVPKLMVSTVASGNTAPYVGPNDIAMMYSVTDIAGINAISRVVLGNAAHAAAGMAKFRVPTGSGDKPASA